MSYRTKAKLEGVQQRLRFLDQAYKSAKNDEIRAQFAMLDIQEEVNKLRVEEAELNLEIAKEATHERRWSF